MFDNLAFLKKITLVIPATLKVTTVLASLNRTIKKVTLIAMANLKSSAFRPFLNRMVYHR